VISGNCCTLLYCEIVMYSFSIVDIQESETEWLVGTVKCHTGICLLVDGVDLSSAFNCRTVLSSSEFLRIT